MSRHHSFFARCVSCLNPILTREEAAVIGQQRGYAHKTCFKCPNCEKAEARVKELREKIKRWRNWRTPYGEDAIMHSVIREEMWEAIK